MLDAEATRTRSAYAARRARGGAEGEQIGIILERERIFLGRIAALTGTDNNITLLVFNSLPSQY